MAWNAAARRQSMAAIDLCPSALTERVRDVAAGRKGAVSGRFVSRSPDEKSQIARAKKRLNQWKDSKEGSRHREVRVWGHKSKKSLFSLYLFLLFGFVRVDVISRPPELSLAVLVLTTALIICSSFSTKSTFLGVVSEASTALWLLQASLALSYESLAVMNLRHEFPTRCQLSPHTFSGRGGDRWGLTRQAVSCAPAGISSPEQKRFGSNDPVCHTQREKNLKHLTVCLPLLMPWQSEPSSKFLRYKGEKKQQALCPDSII